MSTIINIFAVLLAWLGAGVGVSLLLFKVLRVGFAVRREPESSADTAVEL